MPNRCQVHLQARYFKCKESSRCKYRLAARLNEILLFKVNFGEFFDDVTHVLDPSDKIGSLHLSFAREVTIDCNFQMIDLIRLKCRKLKCLQLLHENDIDCSIRRI